jgi:hypothetical protein
MERGPQTLRADLGGGELVGFSRAAIDVNTMPVPETPPGRAPCDALPSVRSRAPRAAQVSERGDGGPASSRHTPSRSSRAR